MEHKQAAGWTWGSVKDESKKTHPCMVAYSMLPKEQRLKDAVVLHAYLAVSEVIDRAIQALQKHTRSHLLVGVDVDIAGWWWTLTPHSRGLLAHCNELQVSAVGKDFMDLEASVHEVVSFALSAGDKGT